MRAHDWDRSTPGAGGSKPLEVQVKGSAVLVRNAKLPDSPVLEFDRAAWKEFLAAVRAGEFDIS